MPTTLQQLRDATYNILNENQNSTTYPATLVDQMINMAELKICNGAVSKYSTWEVLEPGALPFLTKMTTYTSVQDSFLSVDAVIGGTTLTISDTTDYPGSWTLWIDQDVVSYTGKTATQFTGCTGIVFAHKGGTRVSFLFTLPTDFMNSIRVTWNRNFQIDFKDYRNIYLDLKDNKGIGSRNYISNNSSAFGIANNMPYPFYTIVDGAYFLLFQVSASKLPITMQYNKFPIEMAVATDVCTVPDRWAKNTIPYLAVADMFMNRWEESRGMALNDNFGYNQVKSLYDYYNKQHSENIFGNRVVSAKDGNLNI